MTGWRPGIRYQQIKGLNAIRRAQLKFAWNAAFLTSLFLGVGGGDRSPRLRTARGTRIGAGGVEGDAPSRDRRAEGAAGVRTVSRVGARGWAA